MPSFTLTTLGRFAFEVDGKPIPPPSTKKARAILAYILMHKGADLPRETLMDTFWRDAEPERARDSLKTALWLIRQSLRAANLDAEALLPATKSVVRWTADIAIDAELFARAANGKAEDAAKALQSYGGDFLPEDLDDWAIAERERLSAAYESLLARSLRDTSDPEIARRLLLRNPYDERAYVVLIESELALDRPLAAAAHVERCREALAEVGEKPSAEFESRFGNLIRSQPEPAQNPTLPFIGRDEEIAALDALFFATLAGHGHIALVHGEPGIGKSTLLDRAIDASKRRGLNALVVRALDADTRTFGPWPSLFETLCGEDFAAFSRSHAPDLPLAFASAVRAHLTNPSVIFVEDAHDLKAEALDIFVALARSTAPPHAIVVTSRPERMTALRLQLADCLVQELQLGALGRQHVATALSHLVTGDHAELATLLYSRTAGQPLFIAGLLQSLAERGTLQRDGRGWRLASALDPHMELPDSLKRAIEVRLRTRGEDACAVACALALEPAATADDLIEVLQIPESKAFTAIDELLEYGLIHQLEGGPQFGFGHDLIREVAASALNVGRRTALHRGFARRLEASLEPDAALRRARHLAGSNQQLASGESYVEAATQALQANAARDAIELCSEGLRTVERLEEKPQRDTVLARLRMLAAAATMTSGAVDEAMEPASAAITAARRSGHATVLAEALILRASIANSTFDGASALTHAQNAADTARQSDDPALLSEALTRKANAARLIGAEAESLAAAEEACRVAGSMLYGNESKQAAFEELLRVQASWWHFGDALATSKLAFEEGGHEPSAGYASLLHARATLNYLLGRYAAAARDVNEAFAMANAVGRRRRPITEHAWLSTVMFGCHHMRGLVACAHARWSEALEEANAMLALGRIAQLPAYVDIIRLLQIDGLLGRAAEGDNETAAAFAAELSAESAARACILSAACPSLEKARISARRGEPALTLLRQALDALEENARRTPLEADRAFEQLAAAAAEAGDDSIRARALGRRDHYRARRMVAAGTAWGSPLFMPVGAPTRAVP